MIRLNVQLNGEAEKTFYTIKKQFIEKKQSFPRPFNNTEVTDIEVLLYLIKSFPNKLAKINQLELELSDINENLKSAYKRLEMYREIETAIVECMDIEDENYDYGDME